MRLPPYAVDMIAILSLVVRNDCAFGRNHRDQQIDMAKTGIF
jgi:hypothetical protein